MSKGKKLPLARRAYRVGYTYEEPSGRLHSYSQTVMATDVSDAEQRVLEQFKQEAMPRCTIIGVELVA